MFNDKDILLPISNLWREKLLKAGAAESMTKVFRLGIDLSRFVYSPTHKIGDTINILSVGRLVGQKGYEYAIEGVAKYARLTNKKIVYNIIGIGGLEESLKQLVKKLNAADVITFLGAKTQDSVKSMLLDSDVFLLPSVTDKDGYMEGIPVALMEAMATGKICISTYHSGIPELIEDKVSGFLCKEKSSEEICDALLCIEQMDETTVNNMTSAAYTTVLKQYNKANEISNIESLIHHNSK